MARKPRKKVGPKGLKQDGTPNAHWQKFFLRLEAHSTTPLKEWRIDQLLGHLVRRYKEFFGVSYPWAFSGAPSKCSEVYAMNRMLSVLPDSSIETGKAYVDWVFDERLRKEDPIRSLAFFFSVALCRQFNAWRARNTVMGRHVDLPTDVFVVVRAHSADIRTYGDLAFAWMAAKSTRAHRLAPMFSALRAEGFDPAVLEELA